ncbi:glutaminase A [Aeromicrobium sp. P5_D10]
MQDPHPRETREQALSPLIESAALAGRTVASAGQVTTRIAQLTCVDTGLFGIALTTTDGVEVVAGDAGVPFSLQSIAKLFALCALLRLDPLAWEHVGWDISDLGYDSLTDLERHDGRPRNPFVNAGALIVSDRLLSLTGSADQAVGDLITEVAGTKVVVDTAVSDSESLTDHRNRAIAHLLAGHGRLQNPVEDVLATYHRQCAIAASSLTVARASRLLVDRRCEVGIDRDNVRRINAVLMTAGMYSAAGDMAHRIGLPAKSGIGGGVVAVLPNVGTICAWSPPLDELGNSIGAVAAIEALARSTHWSLF